MTYVENYTCSGYMPPEYAVHGHYSVKSDVFGFGVIVLEIVSGNRNRGYSDPEHSLNLLGHVSTITIHFTTKKLNSKQIKSMFVLTNFFEFRHGDYGLKKGHWN